MRTFVGSLSVSLLGLLFSATAAHAVTVYFNDFETAVGPELTSTSGPLGIDRTPTGNRGFLGRLDQSPILGLNNETVTLSLSGLAAHTSATVTLKLFILQSWDGNNAPGPDIWQAGHSGSLVNLQNTTFGIAQSPQCFPADCPASNPARTGADEPPNSLGYTFFGDSVYDLSYTFAHTGPAFTLQFTASDLQLIEDESWGVDNLRVEINQAAVPEPMSLLLVALGLAGVALTRRKRSQAGAARKV